MLIAVDGLGFVSDKMAFELIQDFIKPIGFVGFVFARTESDPDGLRNAYDATMDLCDRELAHVPFLWNNFDEFIQERDEKIFLVLGSEEQEENISRCLGLGIPVYDLSKALYPITS